MNKNPFFIKITIIIFLFACLSLNASYPTKEERISKRRTSYFKDSNLFDGHTVLKWKEEINLTAAQQEKIENIMLSHKDFFLRSSAEIKMKELQCATYLKSKETDRKVIEKLVREISAARTEVILSYLNYLLDVKELLTPSQVEKLKAIKNE
jgi:Spy/CpxP family protein refolding chaperone